MLANAASMGLTLELLQEDIASRFNTAGPWENHDLPPSLQPTSLQKEIIHHPWIDLCPVASIRDVLLRTIDQYDDEELCGDLFGKCHVESVASRVSGLGGSVGSVWV